MLPDIYRDLFDDMLANVARGTPDPVVPLTPFWPIRGARYDSQLLVIGRSVNGWVDDWTAEQLQEGAQRGAAIDFLRADAEPAGRDRMAWVTDLCGAPTGYSTRRSAFWRVLRRLSTGDQDVPDWPSHLAWTNLYKVSPAAGWNPGADLQRLQRADAIALLALEITAFAPKRILALTGNWIDPFTEGLGLRLSRREGLVEGLGERLAVPVVVAKHPMTKPEHPFVLEVREAFAELGVPLP